MVRFLVCQLFWLKYGLEEICKQECAFFGTTIHIKRAAQPSLHPTWLSAATATRQTRQAGELCRRPGRAGGIREEPHDHGQGI
jgi:hypothetical protein